MNYIKIKGTALLLMIQASHLNATTANSLLSTTQDKVNTINKKLNELSLTTKKRYSIENNDFHKIINLKKEIITLIDFDKNVIKYKAPNSKETLLISAAPLGLPEIIEHLLNKGADIDAKDSNGCTPLMWAVRVDQHDSIELLLNCGANITVKNNNKKTALDIAIEKLERYLNNETSVDENINLFEKSPNIKATEKTIELLKTARMYLYITRSILVLFGVLFGVLLVLWLESIGWGINFYLSELTQIRD